MQWVVWAAAQLSFSALPVFFEHKKAMGCAIAFF